MKMRGTAREVGEGRGGGGGSNVACLNFKRSHVSAFSMFQVVVRN